MPGHWRGPPAVYAARELPEGWRGHLWQGRFASFVMEEAYLRSAVRYVEMNPVRARLVREPGRYRWSSAKAHLTARMNGLVKVSPLPEAVWDWRKVLGKEGGTE